MTNEERRAALNMARKRALEHAILAERLGGYSDDRLADMWAHVASAMKDGDPTHDSSDGESVTHEALRPDGTYTRGSAAVLDGTASFLRSSYR